MNRYISRQILWLFVAAVVGLVLFTSLTLAVQLSDLILRKSETFLTVFRLLALKIPDFLGFALPMALVVSTFIILARMVHDQEVLAFQLGGYSLKRITYPIIFLGLLVTFATFGINNYLVPWANYEYREAVYTVTTNNPLPAIQSDLFFKDPTGRIVYVGEYDENEGKAEDVVIFNTEGLKIPGFSTQGDYPELLSSDVAYLGERGWQFKDGRLVGLGKSGEVTYSVGFDGLTIDFDDALQNLVLDSRKVSELRAGELWRRAQAARGSGRVAEDIEFAFYSRISQSLAALVFVLFSAPLSLLLRHRSKAVGVLLALLSVGGYQGVLLWAKSSVRRAGLNPLLGAWLPDIIFGSLGLLLFLLLDRAGSGGLRFRLSRREREGG